VRNFENSVQSLRSRNKPNRCKGATPRPKNKWGGTTPMTQSEKAHPNKTKYPTKCRAHGQHHNCPEGIYGKCKAHGRYHL
jgi:hypothetical protein